VCKRLYAFAHGLDGSPGSISILASEEAVQALHIL
jgi:hypothetical protein